MSKVLELRERAAVPYHCWSVDEFHRMAGAGLLDESDRVELIDGELVDLAPIGSRHAFRVDRIARALQLAVGKAILVRTQNPLLLGDRSEPQPGMQMKFDCPSLAPGSNLRHDSANGDKHFSLSCSRADEPRSPPPIPIAGTTPLRDRLQLGRIWDRCYA